MTSFACTQTEPEKTCSPPSAILQKVERSAETYHRESTTEIQVEEAVSNLDHADFRPYNATEEPSKRAPSNVGLNSQHPSRFQQPWTVSPRSRYSNFPALQEASNHTIPWFLQPLFQCRLTTHPSPTLCCIRQGEEQRIGRAAGRGTRKNLKTGSVRQHESSSALSSAPPDQIPRLDPGCSQTRIGKGMRD